MANTILAKRFRTSLFAYTSALKHQIIKKYSANYTSGCLLSFAMLHGFLAQLGLCVRLDKRNYSLWQKN